MAVTRKLLESMGLTEAQISAIIEEHDNTIKGLKADRDKYKEAADKLPAVQKELDELKAAGGDWETRYNNEKKAHDDYRAEVTRKETQAAKEKAFRQMCKDANISEKRIETVVKASGAVIEAMELDKDGKPKKAEELAENIKTEWSDFVVTTNSSGAEVDHPPANTGGRMTRDEIRKITDPVKRQKAIKENMELYNRRG